MDAAVDRARGEPVEYVDGRMRNMGDLSEGRGFALSGMYQVHGES